MDESYGNPELDAGDLTRFEERLAAWRPSAGVLDRDRVLYQSGYAAGRAEVWIGTRPLAMAALVVISLGLSGLVVHDRLLLMRERAQRPQIETTNIANAGRSATPLASRDVPDDPAPLEPFAPSSYFSLTSRLAKGDLYLLKEFEVTPEPHGPAVDIGEDPTFSTPLRFRDIERVLDL